MSAVADSAHREQQRWRVLSPTNRRARLRDIVTSWPVARVIGARDIKVKYKQSALGPIWLVLQPLGILVAITVAFSGVTDVDTGDVPYLAFALVGVTVWTFISTTLAIAPQAMLLNASLVRRSPAPRIAFVTGSLYSNLPQLAIMGTITLIGALTLNGLGPELLTLPLFVAWLLIFTWSVVLLIAPVAARFRDAVAVVPLLIQAGIFLAPIGYPLDSAPDNVKLLLSLNPVSGLTEGWRWAVLGISPDLTVMAIGGVWTLILLVVGWHMWGRLEVRLADFI